MPTVGAGVCEVCVRAEGAFRVFYVAKFAEGVYVLHAWHPRLGEIRRPIEVTGRDVIRLDLSF